MKVITIGKRLVSVQDIAFVEPFDRAANPEFKSGKDFKGRIVLLDRDAVLTEQTPKAFAEEHGLHLFTQDDVAVNRSIVFKIETFEPNEAFNPVKPYKTRLKWRDTGGSDQSKLLVTPPETVMAEIIAGKVKGSAPAKRAARRPGRSRKGSQPAEAPRN